MYECMIINPSHTEPMSTVVSLPRVRRTRDDQRAFAADVFERRARGNRLGEAVQVVHVVPAQKR